MLPKILDYDQKLGQKQACSYFFKEFKRINTSSEVSSLVIDFSA
jgi:hypothetical protein